MVNSHGKLPTAATLTLQHIATTTITSRAHKTRGATIGIVVASATLTATRLTIAMRPWAIDSVAARFSRRALRSNWLEKAHQRHLQLQRGSMAPACRTQIAAPTHGVQMQLISIGVRR